MPPPAPLGPSELILNPDGSVYHLHLRPGEVAPTIITVGDPERVAAVSDRFDRVDVRRRAREFVTHTGELNGHRLTVISTGVGTDNVDIVLNELDALFNIDLTRRRVRDEFTRLTFLRLGTSGALQPDLRLGALLLSAAALGADGLLSHYPTLTTKSPPGLEELRLPGRPGLVYPDLPPAVATAEELLRGVTLTAAGFYGPQGRSLRLASALDAAARERLRGWRTPEGWRVTNLEMETAGIYGLATALGHRSASISALLANRATGAFHPDPGAAVERLISVGLRLLTA